MFNPKLYDSRDVIAELLNAVRELALHTLRMIKSLLERLNSEAKLLIDKLIHGLNEYTRQVTGEVSKLLPFVGKTNTARENSKAEVLACDDQTVKEIENNINNVGTVASNSIKFSQNTVDETKTCTELNYGIQRNTEDCLQSVTRRTRTTLDMYESQKNNALNIIETSINNLGRLFEECTLKHNGIASPVPVLPTPPIAPKLCIGFFGC
ncbi:uncharacterized protein [Epargyreus clarus]|uniref:uncharacterized protein n=1 Tax=Epargyreus clarus TaxID=520877 RepID=UPI003C2D3DCF